VLVRNTKDSRFRGNDMLFGRPQRGILFCPKTEGNSRSTRAGGRGNRARFLAALGMTIPCELP